MSPYAVTKLAGENYLRVFAQVYGMETLTIRYFNVFGPRQDPTSQYSGVITKYMTAALQRTGYVVYGDGLQGRDFTFIDNVVHANLLALRAPKLDGQSVNVACGRMYTLLDLIAAINDAAGVDLSVEYRDARVGDVRFSQASIAAAEQVLGYTPQIEFQEGIRRTLEWYASIGVDS